MTQPDGPDRGFAAEPGPRTPTPASASDPEASRAQSAPGCPAPGADLVVGELRGYRRFRLGTDGLYPAVHAVRPWSGETEHAICAVGGEHPAPARGCGCGLYGWYHPVDATMSGYGEVTAVVAARGRTILGDHGFRAASARIEAVTLPWLRPTRRVREMLATSYPHTAVYRSRRRMLRDHPAPALSALGVVARPSRAARSKRIALLVWLVGLLAIYSVVAVPREQLARAGAAVWLAALGAFLAWQALLIWLVTRGEPQRLPLTPPGSSTGGTP